MVLDQVAIYIEKNETWPQAHMKPNIYQVFKNLNVKSSTESLLGQRPLARTFLRVNATCLNLLFTEAHLTSEPDTMSWKHE